MSYELYAPVRLFFGNGVLDTEGYRMKDLGNRALVVTGRSSALKSGALHDLEQCLKRESIDYVVFDGIPENPDFDSVMKGQKAALDFGAQFVVGAGGGSPMDAAKAVSLLAADPSLSPEDLMIPQDRQGLPVVCVATTAGSGSEATPYSILTLDRMRTKSSIRSRIWPVLSFTDPVYLETMPEGVRISTALDTLMHLLESILAVRADRFSVLYAREGLGVFSGVRSCLTGKEPDSRQYSLLAEASILGGLAISRTGTSLPHGMGYLLTIRHGLPHGLATAVLAPGWLKGYPDQARVSQVLEELGFSSLEEFSFWLGQLIPDGQFSLSPEEVELYVEEMMLNRDKLSNHPDRPEARYLKEMYLRAPGRIPGTRGGERPE